METGEIIAVVVIIVVIVLGVIFLCFRCWRAIAEVTEDAQKSQRQTFTRNFRDGIRQSFRSSFKRVSSLRSSFRRGGSGRHGDNVSGPKPTPAVVTIESLSKERSEIHPYYLQKGGRANEKTPSYDDSLSHDALKRGTQNYGETCAGKEVSTPRDDRAANSRSYQRLVEHDSPGHQVHYDTHFSRSKSNLTSQGFSNPGYADGSPTHRSTGGASAEAGQSREQPTSQAAHAQNAAYYNIRQDDVTLTEPQKGPMSTDTYI